MNSRQTYKIINCQICREPAARLDGAKLIVFSHSATHSAELNAKDVLEGLAAAAEGLMILRDLFDREDVKFFVK